MREDERVKRGGRKRKKRRKRRATFLGDRVLSGCCGLLLPGDRADRVIHEDAGTVGSLQSRCAEGNPKARAGRAANLVEQGVKNLELTIDHRLTWIPSIVTDPSTRSLQRQRITAPHHKEAEPHHNEQLERSYRMPIRRFLRTPAPVARGCFIGGGPDVACVAPYAVTGATSCRPSP
ncbi:hypothetical protein HPB52_010225 [Rhipicephalus sanguineus]|uniref:Uncharacterized protein n=1 Tax=Rhipicephalus sanguineus TaxID=34632 RepID=A0A9D4PR58_RHISA|nr:hypothetical protein HPB52_010225 [Rhipicephalus sanguineus]